MRFVVLLLLAACAGQPAPPSAAVAHASLLPGSIGVLVEREAAGIVVSAVHKESAAAKAGVRAGDVVLRYNGAPVADAREFNSRVVDSPPGSTVQVELLRDGKVHRLELPVRELDTMPRV
jgi:S1-C subfamily serine protease